MSDSPSSNDPLSSDQYVALAHRTENIAYDLITTRLSTQRIRLLHGAKGIFNAAALKEEGVVLVEGVFDALACLAGGLPAAASARFWSLSAMPWTGRSNRSCSRISRSFRLAIRNNLPITMP